VTHDEITELLASYALDAVSPEEAAEIEEHLAGCPRCRAELAAHREVAGVLGNLGGAPPADGWDRIAEELGISSAAPTPLGEPGASRRSERRRRAVILGAVAALAAALAIVVAILSAKVVNLDNRVSALSAGILRGAVAAQAVAAEHQPGSVTIELTAPASPWSAKVVALPDGQAFLLPGKMPIVGSNTTFQAWAVVGGRYISLGVLGPRPVDTSLHLEPGMTALLVNTEPRGGSVQPTTKPFITGSLPKTL
jgi:anti-sigma factor RsiW